MRSEFKNLRLKQLDRALKPYRAARDIPRPSNGWIRTIRQALGVSSGELARRLGTSRQLPLQLEKGEAEDRVTLKITTTWSVIALAMLCLGGLCPPLPAEGA